VLETAVQLNGSTGRAESGAKVNLLTNHKNLEGARGTLLIAVTAVVRKNQIRYGENKDASSDNAMTLLPMKALQLGKKIRERDNSE